MFSIYCNTAGGALVVVVDAEVFCFNLKIVGNQIDYITHNSYDKQQQQKVQHRMIN